MLLQTGFSQAMDICLWGMPFLKFILLPCVVRVLETVRVLKNDNNNNNYHRIFHLGVVENIRLHIIINYTYRDTVNNLLDK